LLGRFRGKGYTLKSKKGYNLRRGWGKADGRERKITRAGRTARIRVGGFANFPKPCFQREESGKDCTLREREQGTVSKSDTEGSWG